MSNCKHTLRRCDDAAVRAVLTEAAAAISCPSTARTWAGADFIDEPVEALARLVLEAREQRDALLAVCEATLAECSLCGDGNGDECMYHDWLRAAVAKARKS